MVSASRSGHRLARRASQQSLRRQSAEGRHRTLFIVRPLVILLDDPTRGIDVGAKAEVHQILNGMTRQGRGVLLVSSELPEVLAMSDRVLAMYGGRVVAELPHGADHEAVMQLITESKQHDGRR